MEIDPSKKQNSILFEDRAAIEKIGSEQVLVHFLMDAEGTLFLKYDPTEMLDSVEQDLYFLAHPNGKQEMVREKLGDIVKRNELEDLFMSIQVPNIYAVADILADKWLASRGYSEQDITTKRAEIETKMRKWNDPSIIEQLTKKYPGLAITVFTQASPAPYVRESYQETLKDTGAGIIIASGNSVKAYTKASPELYQIVKENRPGITAFIDDDAKRMEPATQGGIDVVTFYKGADKEELRAASEKTLDEAYELGDR